LKGEPDAVADFAEAMQEAMGSFRIY